MQIHWREALCQKGQCCLLKLMIWKLILPQLKAEISQIAINSVLMDQIETMTQSIDKKRVYCILKHSFKDALLFLGESALPREGLSAQAPPWLVPKVWQCWGKEVTHSVYLQPPGGKQEDCHGNGRPTAHGPWSSCPSCCCPLASCTQVPQHPWASLYGSEWAWEKGVTWSRAAFLYLPNNYSLTKVSKTKTFPDSISWYLLL